MIPSKQKKEIHEHFTRFFEQPTRESLASLIMSNFGETDFLDFKSGWPEYSDFARHVLAFANSGGGVVVLGVRQEDDGSLESVGIDGVRDKADISKALDRFLPPPLEYVVLDFSYRSSEYGELVGKSFQVIVVESDDRRIPCTMKSRVTRRSYRLDAYWLHTSAHCIQLNLIRTTRIKTMSSL